MISQRSIQRPCYKFPESTRSGYHFLLTIWLIQYTSPFMKTATISIQFVASKASSERVKHRKFSIMFSTCLTWSASIIVPWFSTTSRAVCLQPNLLTACTEHLGTVHHHKPVFSWYAQFRHGEEKIEDEDRSSRPPSYFSYFNSVNGIPTLLTEFWNFISYSYS